jgi:hypothetical protein
MKKILIILIALTTTLVSMTVLTDLYTRNQIDSLIEEICDNYNPYVIVKDYNYQTKKWKYVKNKKNNNYVYRDDIVRPLNLPMLLQENKYALSDGSTLLSHEAEAFSNWKLVIANNPSLTYTSLDLYGDLIIRQIGSRLDYLAAQRNSYGFNQSDSYTKKKFWNANTRSIKQYQILIDKLLELNDKDLNYFITTNDISAAASYEFNSWLKKKDLLNSGEVNVGRVYGNQEANYWGCYPGDLLCLTKRVFERHPQWTPRKFLTEAKKFSTKVLEIIEDNN